MDIIIRNSGGVPIYDQITRQMKGLILRGELKEGEALPSMRLLAKELRISVITTKRAYEELEREGFLTTVPGKGCFVAPQNPGAGAGGHPPPGRGAPVPCGGRRQGRRRHPGRAHRDPQPSVWRRNTMKNALEVSHLTKDYGSFKLDDVSFTVPGGTIMGLIGENGAGKSTMLNAVAGVWPVDCGKIIIDGVDVTRLGEHQRAAYIGRVFQDPMTGTAATMQIEENLALAARRGKPRTLRIGITRAEREQYRELLKSLDLGLENRLTARVGLLSGGQRQALTLLMATMNKPKLLLLDEHTAALDPKTALKVLTLSAKIVEENHLTTMMITHNMKDAIKYGNRLIMMHEGHIIYDVSGEEKKNLQVSDLLAKFQIASGGEFANDRMILS